MNVQNVVCVLTKEKSLKIQKNEEIQNAKVNPLDKPETEDTSWIGGVKKWYE